jgi:hypothetical protein
MSSVTYALAPNWQDLPDVIVSDGDFNTAQGLTIDFNFFVYVNALRILDYVSDEDSDLSSTDGRFAFQEATDDDNLSLAGESQLGAVDVNDRDAWDNFYDTNTTGFPFVTIRDLIRSPTGGTDPPGAAFPNPTTAGGTPITDYDLGTTPSLVQTQLPWHNDEAQDGVLVDTDPQARVVAMWVADEDTAVSDTMLVYSINNATNELSGGFTTLFDTGFPTENSSLPDWEVGINGAGALSSVTLRGDVATGNFIGAQADAQTPTGGQFLRYVTTTDPADVNGIQGRIPFIEGDSIYESRHTLSLAVHATTGGPADRQNAPDIRIGAIHSFGQVAFTTIINSSNASNRAAVGNFDPQLPNVGESQTFVSHWDSHSNSPNVNDMLNPLGLTVDARTFHGFFDILNVGSVGGSDQSDEGIWDLTAYSVGAITKPPTLTGSSPASRFYTIGNIAVSNGFAQQGISGSMTFVEHTTGSLSGGATFGDSGGNNTGTPGFLLMQNVEAAVWLSGITIRVTAKVSCPTDTDRLNYKGFRLRHDQGFGNMITVVDIQQNEPDSGGLNSAPYVPISRTDSAFASDGPTSQISYIDPYNGPSADFLAAPSSFRDWHLALDIVPPNNAGALPTTANEITVHEVIYEVFDEL